MSKTVNLPLNYPATIRLIQFFGNLPIRLFKSEIKRCINIAQFMI